LYDRLATLGGSLDCSALCVEHRKEHPLLFPPFAERGKSLSRMLLRVFGRLSFGDREKRNEEKMLRIVGN